jgi:hypothetical protein
MKLNKYNKFLLESLFYDLLLESKLEYMTDFNSVLTELKNDSMDGSVRKIADFLLKIEKYGADLKLIQNYISVDDDASKVSFIPDNKVSTDPENSIVKITTRDNSLSTIVTNHPILTTIGLNRDELKYPNYTDEIPSNRWKVIGGPYPGELHGTAFSVYTLYYLENIDDPSYKVVVCDNSRDSKKAFTKTFNLPEELRGNVKIGRFINRIMDIWFKDYPNEFGPRESYTAADIEKFVNAYTSAILYKKNVIDFFEVVSGKDIKYWYLSNNYAAQLGQLGSSCMKSKECQSFFKIYTENPEVCQLLIFKNKEGDKINGRALLWTDEDGKKWIDRVYTIKDNYMQLFTKWCELNGYENAYGTGERIKVVVKNKDYDKYPYMDTFCIYKRFTDNDRLIGEEAYLYSDNYNAEEPYFILRSTSGRSETRD